ncbi:MAG: sialate O-acetylesterase [Candidatus Solibacter usitatus]|nr:sialate O-acetylesterase [Candidatus Solibacter usitatus]
MILPAAAQPLQVTKGAADYQVFQRGPGNSASVKLEGTVAGLPPAAPVKGKAKPAAPVALGVEARVIAGGMTVAGFDWKEAGKTNGVSWTAEIANLPTGGPYRLDLRVAGSAAVTTISDLLVGDLYILAGQSNMEGVGNLENTPLPSALVNSLDMTDTWVAAADPLHRLPDSTDAVHWRRNAQGQAERLTGDALRQWIANRKKGAGVGLPFALEMVRRTGVPVGLIPCAHGGTSMAQWDPQLKDKGGDSLYGGTLRRFRLAGGKVKGILWYQGESDAGPKTVGIFEEKLRGLIQAFRDDFNQPDLPFYQVQIGRHVAMASPVEWNRVQDLQLKVESGLPNVFMTGCTDCQLDDGIHVGTDDFRLLAVRLANLATGSTRKGPRPVSAKVVKGNVVVVEFAEVNGKLVHEGRLNGFSIHDASGAPQPLVFRQRVSTSNPNAVELLFGGKLPEGATVQHGYGRDPYLNLRDEAGMPAPVFGPLPIQK